MYVTYRFNASGLTDSLHCNYYTKIQGPKPDCNLNTQNVAIRFGNEFPFMTNCCFQGFNATEFQILAQKVTGSTTQPDPGQWRVIDFTSQLSANTINGCILTSGLTGGTFVITNAGGGIYTATNPTSTWTSRTSPFTSGGPGIYEATYVAGSINLFLIGMQSSSAGSQGILASSPDGITWTNRKFSTASGQGVNSITHNNSTIFVSATPQTQGAYSTNGTSYTTFNPGTGESIEYFSGTFARFVGLGSNAVNCISQTAANISTIWTTAPTTSFSLHLDTPSQRGTTNPTSTFGAPMYDSVRNRYYLLANNDNEWYLNTYDASSLVTIAATSGSNTIYSYKLIDSELLPFGYAGNTFTNVTLGYGNNKIIYAASNTSSGMRIFYADIA
jgi:hypothetical protein